jgi:hypothetical protein
VQSKEIMAISTEINTKHVNAFCGQIVAFFNVTPGGTHIDHLDFIG